jgi:hypothetical protein
MQDEIEKLKLRPNAKLVALVFAGYADKFGGNMCPAVDTISAKTSLCTRAVRKILRTLRDEGVLVPTSSTKGGRLPTTYRFSDAILERIRAGQPCTPVQPIRENPEKYKNKSIRERPLVSGSRLALVEPDRSSPSLHPDAENENASASDTGTVSNRRSFRGSTLCFWFVAEYRLRFRNAPELSPRDEKAGVELANSNKEPGYGMHCTINEFRQAFRRFFDDEEVTQHTLSAFSDRMNLCGYLREDKAERAMEVRQ